MTAIAIEDLLDRVRPECPRAPVELMEQVFRDVARDFCQFTRAYVYEASDSITALVADYDIQVPNTQVEPVAIEFMQVEKCPSIFRDTAWLDRYIADWRARDADDTRYFTILQPGTITFPGVPLTSGTVGGMQYRVSIKPKINATTIDDSFTNVWIEALSDGTKARIKAMSGNSWADPSRAAVLEGMYRSERGKARIRAQKSYGNANLIWSGPKFAGK